MKANDFCSEIIHLPVRLFLIFFSLFLAVFDSLYLIFSIGEHGIIDLLRSHTLYCINCIVSNFSSNLCTAPAIKEPMWYRITYPYILWPMNKMFFAATVFMIVAISAERHRAICSPLTHRPTFWPYVLLVLCISGECTNTTLPFDVLSIV